MKPLYRKLIGMVVAPLAPTLMMVKGFNLASHTGLVLTAAFITGGYTLSFIFGVPAYLVLQRCRWTGWPHYVAAAFIVGAMGTPILGLGWVYWRTSSMAAVLHTAMDVRLYPGSLFIGVLTIPVGLLFWLIVRPDRTSSAFG